MLLWILLISITWIASLAIVAFYFYTRGYDEAFTRVTKTTLETMDKVIEAREQKRRERG